jgi:hypothetical protein
MRSRSSEARKLRLSSPCSNRCHAAMTMNSRVVAIPAAVGQALRQYFPVGVTLVKQTRNHVLTPRFAAGLDRRPNVAQIEGKHLVLARCEASDGGQPSFLRATRRKEAVQSFSHSGLSAFGQAHDLGSDGHRHLQAHGIKVRVADQPPQTLDQALAQIFHELAVSRSDDLRREEARRRAALLLMGFTILKQDRCVLHPDKSLERFGPEFGLAKTIASRDLARRIEVTVAGMSGATSS